ncbi:YqhR family membrane protein [Niallia taxi]|uniref:YqhR family membrane protein n=1 Tax=Niallia taxi TaxID=2499688 RepID=UPI0011A2DBCE|nr:YqhR family membrane protein [Niallia taxi]MCT2346284.1 YqhR family membrane protein [Niallia taxi]MDE5052131.1 YqhR family membrane protein [Niallia taxi]MED3961985.1 YqhR family membrane protein [Niallia taxi]WOD64370.1 YqhR family membrane protein [Niallia taxi]
MTKEKEAENHSGIAKEPSMHFITLVIWTGLFGGIFWSFMGFLAYYFNMTEIRPNVILEPWAIGSWKTGWLGTLISIGAIGFFSLMAAFGYYLLLRKFKSFYIGVGFGIMVFGVVFIILNPIFPSIKPFMQLSLNTIITSICLYVLWGVFVGYTISYEESEIRTKKQKENKREANISGSEG